MSGDVTGMQLRAARNALGWPIEHLAKVSGVSVRTIIRFEDGDGVPSSRSGTLRILMGAFESAGIEFVGAPDDRPGIRILTPRRAE